MSILKNARHERFAQEIAKGSPAISAYGTAGYKPDAGAASRLSGNVRVRERVAELLASGARRAEVTIASVVAELEEARAIAKDQKQPSAMVAASMGKAKVVGLIAEKLQHTGADGEPLEAPVSTRDLARAVLGLLREAQLTPTAGEDARAALRQLN